MELTKVERERIAVLERRVDHLTKALEDWKGKDTGRARAEREALLWALTVINSHFSVTT